MYSYPRDYLYGYGRERDGYDEHCYDIEEDSIIVGVYQKKYLKYKNKYLNLKNTYLKKYLS
jgi:hypothetical protein